MAAVSLSLAVRFLILIFVQNARCQFGAKLNETSCARGDTICLRPLQVDNIFAFIRQVAPVRHVGYLRTSATS